MPSSKDLEKETVADVYQMFKGCGLYSRPADPGSTDVDPEPPHSSFLLSASSLLSIEMNIFTSSGLGLPTIYRKGKRYYTRRPIFNFIL